MFGREVEEDGITSQYEVNGLEKVLTQLIDRHGKYEQRNQVSEDV